MAVAQSFSFRKRPELVRVLAGGEGGNRHGTIIGIEPNSLFVEWHAAATLSEMGAFKALLGCIPALA